MIYTLDKYQKEGLKTIGNSDITILNGKNSSGKSYLIRFLARNKWSQGKSTLIITPNIDEARLLQKHFGIFNLNKYSLVINQTGEISAQNISKIRSLSKEEKVSISKKDIDYNKLLFDKTFGKIKEHFNILNEKMLYNKSLNELVIINAFEASSFKNVHFNQIFTSQSFDFTEAEYIQLQKNIKLAFELFTKGNNKTNNIFHKEAYTNNNPIAIWEEISKWIEKSRVNILNVVQHISGFLHEQSSKHFNLKWEKIKNIEENINKTLLEIDKFNIKYKDFDPKNSGFFSLDKRAKEIKEKYELSIQKIQIDYKSIIRNLHKFPSIKDKHQLPNDEETNIENISTNLLNIQDNIREYENIINTSIIQELKSMNFRNIKNDALNDLQEELKDLFIGLNDSFTVKKWEDNAFSINKQLSYLESTLEELNQIEGDKEDFLSNYEWNKFLHHIDEKSKYIITKLNIYRPKNWTVFFRNWHIQNLILKSKHHINTDISSLMDSLIEINDDNEKLSVIKAIKIWQNKREIYINKLRDSGNNSFIKLLTQTSYKATWDELLEENKHALTSFFPVVIIPKEMMLEYKNKISENFDLIIYKNIDIYKDLLINLIPDNSNSELVFTLEEKDNINEINKAILQKYNNKSINSFELLGFHQQGMMELLDMNYTERLYAARNLAHLMQSANKNIKIFHIKNTILFSAMDDILNKVLVKLLSNQGLKEMKIIDTPFHLIVDNLLEINTKQILLTQNHLLNYKSVDNILWQQYAISKIQKSGMKLINFNTTDLFEDPIKAIKDFVKINIG